MEFVNTYHDLLIHKPQTIRDKVRGVALTTIATTYRLRHDHHQLFSRPRIQFLYIHHVFQDEMEALSDLLESLSREHQFISYTEAVRRLQEGNVDRPYVCISSDDGLKNNLDAAAVLDRFGAKACFFICPSIISETSHEKVGEFAKNRLHFPPVEFLTWEDVALLQKNGHEIGGHTMSHVDIAATPPERLGYEIADCREIIQRRCGSAAHFAFPYGRCANFTEYGRKIVFDSGFISCASAERGCHIVRQGEQIRPEDLFIRRDHVILAWPLEHILFFIARNAVRADLNNNIYPALCG